MSDSNQYGRNPYLRWWIWVTYLVLFLLSVPWYWTFLPQRDLFWLGLPIWVVAAIAGSFTISLFTAWLLCRPWPNEREDRDNAGEK